MTLLDEEELTKTSAHDVIERVLVAGVREFAPSIGRALLQALDSHSRKIA